MMIKKLFVDLLLLYFDTNTVDLFVNIMNNLLMILIVQEENNFVYYLNKVLVLDYYFQ